MPGLPPRHNQHLRAEMMKGFGQDAAETAAGADDGDGSTGQIGHCGDFFMIFMYVPTPGNASRRPKLFSALALFAAPPQKSQPRRRRVQQFLGLKGGPHRQHLGVGKVRFILERPLP